jgi:tRNA pseudouridine65 synthase
MKSRLLRQHNLQMLQLLSTINLRKKFLRFRARGIAHLLHKKSKILHSENEIYAVEKPVNVLSHPNQTSDGKKSIINGLYNHRKERFEICPPMGGPSEVVYLINRLDSATSGVILMTTNETIAKIVKTLFAQRMIVKIYKAIVFNDAKIGSGEKTMLWEDAMEINKINGNNRAQKCKLSSRSGMCALTHVAITDPQLFSIGKSKLSGSDMMFLELRPETGYTHQLRYQCALHLFPIVGDKTYGNFKMNKSTELAAKTMGHLSKIKNCQNDQDQKLEKEDIHSTPDFKRLYLHSYSVEFNYNYGGETFTFKAVSKLPVEFLQIIDNSYQF